MQKKCKQCKAKMSTIMMFEGREYNTGNRSYCFECSPPRLRKDSKSVNAKESDIISKSDETSYHIFGPLSGKPRWVHGIDDLESNLPASYKFCERCNYSYTYSIEMVKEKIRKRGTTMYDNVIRYCEDCYEKVSVEKFAEKIAKQISQTSSCRKCRISHNTYVAYSSLLKCRVIKDGEGYDIICLSCEDDYNN